MSIDNAALLRILFARSPDAMLLLDPHHPTQTWQIVDCSEAACAMNGYTRDELIGQDIDLLHSAPSPAEKRPRLLARLRDEPLQQIELLHRHKNGTIFPVETSVALVTLDGRELILGIDRDITARKQAEQQAQQQQGLLEQRMRERTAQLEQQIAERVRAEEELAASQELFRLLFARSPDAIMLVDPFHASGIWPIVECNPAACTMNGYGRHELIGQTINLLHPVPVTHEAGAAYLARLRAEGAFVTEGQHRRKDGTIFDIEASTSLITLGGRELIVGIDRDVSERRQAEARRIAFEQQLVQVQKLESLRALAGGIAHDFNNILQAIIGNAELALLDLPHTHALYGHIDAITREGRRAARLTQQLLAYAGRGYFALRPLDLNRLLDAQQPLLEHAAHPIPLRIQPQLNLPTVAGDAEQIRQALLNILANAAEAIGDSDGTITLTTSLRTLDAAFLAATYGAPDLPPGDYVTLSVVDTGGGMDKRTLERAGEPFFSTKFPGRGLGLPAVLGIVRGHSGALHIQSTRGQGTTATLFLPTLAGTGAAVARDATGGSRGTIMVVDDEDAVRAVTARMLQHSGYSVLSAADGSSAIDLLRQYSGAIDGVLLDVTMPRMDGAQTMRALHALRPDLRVMLMSGYSEAEALSEISGQRPAGFLHKPFTLAALRAALHTLLGE